VLLELDTTGLVGLLHALLDGLVEHVLFVHFLDELFELVQVHTLHW